MSRPRVSIIGAGYVGIVTGACFAERGLEVMCVDINPSKVDAVNAGRSPIFEPELDALLARNVLETRRLRATLDMAEAVHGSDVTLIAVPTPFDEEMIDLSFVEQVADELGTILRDKPGYHVVGVKSTVIPGTSDGLVLQRLEAASGKNAGRDFGVGMNPEFLSQGEAVADAMTPDRIVVGGIDQRSIEALSALYDAWPGDIPRLRVNCRTAEMVKYASNALLATMISFANDLGDLCERMGNVDVMEVLEGLHLCKELTLRTEQGARHPAALTRYLSAGCGFGGSCLPKDAKALVAQGERLGSPMNVLNGALRTNRGRPARLVELAMEQLGDLRGRTVAVMGLSFKPRTDDMRHSPAIAVLNRLVEVGAEVRAYDPAAGEQARRIFAGQPVNIREQMVDALQGAEVVFLVTSWEEFRALPRILSAMQPAPLLVDGRRMFHPDDVPHYVGIGLGRGRNGRCAACGSSDQEEGDS